MIRACVLATVLASLPTALPGQLPEAAVERRLGVVCDGTEMRRLEERRRMGGALAVGAVAANAVVFAMGLGSRNPEDAPQAIENGRRAMTFALVTLPVAVIGGYMYANSHPGEDFWQRTLAAIKAGETTRADVRSCFHAPSAMSIAGAEERWTYFTRRSDGWSSRHSVGSVSFLFRNGVLAEVRRSALILPHLWSTEAVPVVVPVP